MLLGPLYSLEEKMGGSFVSLTLSIDWNNGTQSSYDYDANNTYEDHLDKWMFFDEPREVRPALGSKEYQNEEAKYYHELAELKHRNRRYPGLCNSFKLNLYVEGDPPAGFCSRHNDWLFLDWIRASSNTSRLFRKEFAEVFWRRVQIETELN